MAAQLFNIQMCLKCLLICSLSSFALDGGFLMPALFSIFVPAAASQLLHIVHAEKTADEK